MIRAAGDSALIERKELSGPVVCIEAKDAKRLDLALDLIEGIDTDDLARLVARPETREKLLRLAEDAVFWARLRKIADHGGGESATADVSGDSPKGGTAPSPATAAGKGG
jgi:hypothetical protein